jgi:exosome complex exonuclease DIS3/RRP44
LKTFDELTVRLSLDSSNLQHRKLVFQLVQPHVPGFSYVPTQEMDVKAKPEEKKETVEVKKRKETKDTKAKKKTKK